jgi:hypothetical protein
MSCCCHAAPSAPARRRFSVLGLLVQLLALYAVLVFGGGTLAKVQHPVAAEIGRLMQTVSLVEPTIRWADSRGYEALSGSLRTLANGLPVERWT